jgi:ATP-dependent Clp protease, protease subunit
MDIFGVLFRNRIIFIGQFITPQVAQRVISQLITLATIDEDSDILVTHLSFSEQSLCFELAILI